MEKTTLVLKEAVAACFLVVHGCDPFLHPWTVYWNAHLVHVCLGWVLAVDLEGLCSISMTFEWKKNLLLNSVIRSSLRLRTIPMHTCGLPKKTLSASLSPRTFLLVCMRRLHLTCVCVVGKSAWLGENDKTKSLQQTRRPTVLCPSGWATRNIYPVIVASKPHARDWV